MFEGRKISESVKRIETTQTKLIKVLNDMGRDIERLKILWEIPCETKTDGEEKWVAVKQIPGCYGFKVSNKGRVKSRTKRILKPKVQDGYMYAQFWDSKAKTVRVCRLDRLVYAMFNNKDLKSCKVTHKDGDFSNCTLENLEEEVMR